MGYLQLNPQSLENSGIAGKKENRVMSLLYKNS